MYNIALTLVTLPAPSHIDGNVIPENVMLPAPLGELVSASVLTPDPHQPRTNPAQKNKTPPEQTAV